MGEIIQFKKKRIPKGLIISGLGGVSNENGPVAKDLTHSDLMFYGLYWDNIVITQIPMFHFTNNVIEEFRSIVKLLYYSYKIRKKLEITHRLSRSTILYAYV